MTPPSEQRRVMSGRCAVLIDALNKALEAFCSYSGKTFGKVMANILRPIAEAMDISKVFVDRQIQTNEESRLMRVYQWSKYGGEPDINNDRYIPESAAGSKWLDILRQGECINQCVSDMSGDEKDIMDEFGVKSIIIIPVFMQGDFWGCVVFLDSENERLMDEDCISIIYSFARLCANAVARDEMEREITRQNEINKIIANEVLEAEERTRIMLDATPLSCQLWTDNFGILDCNNTAIELFGLKDKQEFIERFMEFSPEYQPDGRNSKEAGIKYTSEAFKTGQNVFDWMHVLPDGTLLPVEVTLVRVRYKNNFVVASFTRDLRQIKKMESNILRLESESEKIYYDPLTGIYNRRFFDEGVNRVVNTLSRSGGILSLMMVDIDFFKNYNDTYGHTAGDECLKTIAEILSKSTSRVDDFVARYGGEEFAVVLPNTEEEGARMIADKMLENIRECNMPHENSSVADIVTISIGVTTGKVNPGQRADDFIVRADEQLYKSKQSGRNKYNFCTL